MLWQQYNQGIHSLDAWQICFKERQEGRQKQSSKANPSCFLKSVLLPLPMAWVSATLSSSSNLCWGERRRECPLFLNRLLWNFSDFLMKAKPQLNFMLGAWQENRETLSLSVQTQLWPIQQFTSLGFVNWQSPLHFLTNMMSGVVGVAQQLTSVITGRSGGESCNQPFLWFDKEWHHSFKADECVSKSAPLSYWSSPPKPIILLCVCVPTPGHGRSRKKPATWSFKSKKIQAPSKATISLKSTPLYWVDLNKAEQGQGYIFYGRSLKSETHDKGLPDPHLVRPKYIFPNWVLVVTEHRARIWQ